MSLSEKEVFYSLLKNNHISLKRLCKSTNISYYRLTKRVMRNQLYLLPPVEMAPISQVLGVSFEDLYNLLLQAKRGELPDDYPREKIILKKIDQNTIKRREIIMLLTPEEKELIETHRKALQSALREMPAAPIDTSTDK